MADPVVSVIVEQLVAIADKQVAEGKGLVKGVEKKATNLSIMMKGIQSVLHDAEKRRVERSVKVWLEQLQEAVYDMEDVLDEWHTAILIKKQNRNCDEDDEFVAEVEHKVCCSFLSFRSCVKRGIEHSNIALKIKELNDRLEFIVKDKDQLKLFHKEPSDDSEMKQFKPNEYTYLVNSHEIYGRLFPRESLVSRLLDNNNGTSHGANLDVISIVGTRGLGKTTLAQSIFNDVRVKKSFDYRIWVCVSHPFKEVKVANTILASLFCNSSTFSSIDSLLNQISKKVSRKRILLVLDDVWPHDKQKWEKLRSSLKYVAPQSKILVTTRNKEVADTMGTDYFQELDTLSDSDCLSLINKIALSDRDKEEDRQTFDEIANMLSKKCDGLPIAAKMIGGVLSIKNSVEEWQDILHSNLWELENVEVDLFPLLFLCFNHLPLPARRCLKYCSLFPKDCLIYTKDIIKIWMSQGYIGLHKNDMGVEEKGYRYIETLEKCCFFQEVVRDNSDKKIVAFQLHDVVHDFCRHLMEKECLVMESGDDQIDGTTFRHITVLQSFDTINISSSSCMEKLHSFLVEEIPLNALETLIQSMKYIRSLKLRDCGLKKLPDEIRLLIHLRYLDLSYNDELKELAEGICELCNLETLDLSYCVFLSKLPQEISRLINLIHLLIIGIKRLNQLPMGILSLRKLRTLDRFLVGEGNLKLKDLKYFVQIEGSLRIEFYNYEQSIFDDGVELRNLSRIEVLMLEFHGMTYDRRSRVNVFEALESPLNLNELALRTYVFDHANSLVASSFSNIRRLRLLLCTLITFPPLWKLQYLESLYVFLPRGLEHVELEFMGIERSDAKSSRTSSSPPSSMSVVAFPKLKHLEFDSCYYWKKWEDLPDSERNVISIMPCLEELKLQSCEKLEDLPHAILDTLPKLRHLNIALSHHLLRRFKEDGRWRNAHWLSRVDVETSYHPPQ